MEIIILSVIIACSLVLGWTYLVQLIYERWVNKHFKPSEEIKVKQPKLERQPVSELFDIPEENFEIPDAVPYEEENPDLVHIFIPEIKVTTGFIVKEK